MAPPASKSTGTKLQTWLPISLAEQLKAEAERSSRSVSNLIKVAVRWADGRGPTPRARRLRGSPLSSVEEASAGRSANERRDAPGLRRFWS